MVNEKINLSEKYAIPGNAVLETFVHSDSKEMHPFVQDLPCRLVCPGGGYWFTSEREGEPIAIDFYNRNYNAFVLWYDISQSGARYPLALTELACAVDYIRKNADKFRINPDKIYVSGFSAGGHLVANLANFWHDLPGDFISPEKLNAKPNGIVLGYPVIYPESHMGSYENLLGDRLQSDKALVEKLTLDKTVTDKNPPCFVWTTFEDRTVRPDATLRYADALNKAGVVCECHVFPYGGHGAACCDNRTITGACEGIGRAKIWFDLCAEFLKSL